MKIWAAGLLCLAATACTTIEREAGYPGGNLGYVADKTVLFAKSHDQRVDRFLLSMALLSPLIAETASTATEAKLSAERIDQMYGRLALLKAAADKCNRTATAETVSELNCSIDTFTPDDTTGLSKTNTSFNFETQSYQVSLSLFAATKTALDNLNIRTRASNLAGLSPSEIFRNILRVRFLIPVATRYFATYRDVSTILASSVIDSCDKTACDDVKKAYANLLNRPSPTGDDLVAAERPIGALYAAADAYIEAGNPWNINDVHAAALIAHVDRACARLQAMQQIDALPNDTPEDCSTASTSSNARKLLTAYAADG